MEWINGVAIFMKKINISSSHRTRCNIMIKRLFFLLLVSFSCTIPALQEEASEIEPSDFNGTHFISDDLFIFMHSGPGTNYRIIGSINAGSAIIITEENTESEFTQITDQRGRSGWVKTEFVSATDSVKTQLSKLQARMSEQGDLSASYSQELSLLQARLEQAEQQKQSLEEQTQSLRSQLDNTTQQLEQTQDDGQKELFYMGAIVAGSGLIFGIILTMLLKGRKRSDSLYDRY
jgi:SH3 domain protein